MTKMILNSSLVLAVAGLVACAGTQDQRAFVNPDSLAITSSQLTAADCNNGYSTRAGGADGGGPHRAETLGSTYVKSGPIVLGLANAGVLLTDCTDHRVEVSGTAVNAEFVSVIANEVEGTFTVNADGTFTFTILTPTLENLHISIAAIGFDGIASAEVFQISSLN